MKLQQLHYLREIADSGFNVSRAARALHTSQPGVSRLIRLLEEELGLQLLVRDKKRLTGLTPAGQAIIAVGKRITSDAEILKQIAADYRTGESGELTIATAHTHARYTLPRAIESFIRRYPRVRLQLLQGHSLQLVHWLKGNRRAPPVRVQHGARRAEVQLVPERPHAPFHRAAGAPPRP
jgi:LysR family cys regulon transcriptional activator